MKGSWLVWCSRIVFVFRWWFLVMKLVGLKLIDVRCKGLLGLGNCFILVVVFVVVIVI